MLMLMLALLLGLVLGLAGVRYMLITLVLRASRLIDLFFFGLSLLWRQLDGDRPASDE